MPSIKALKVIKVELEEEEPEGTKDHASNDCNGHFDTCNSVAIYEAQEKVHNSRNSQTSS